ncbi:MAG: hypothetical protein ACP5H2_12685 [Solirubrobacteraceae bacterium]
MASYAEIQRAFAHRYMDAEGVVGVRVQEIDGLLVLVVQASSEAVREAVPDEFRGVPVRVSVGRRPVLAYS